MTTTKELIAGLRARAGYEDNGGVVELALFDMGQLLRDAADRLDALTAPVEGMTLETTPWERDQWRFGVNPFSKEDRERLLRDFNRMIAKVLNGGETIDHLSSALAAEQKRNERLVEALKDAVSLVRSIRGDVPDEWTAALSQEKQTS